MRRADGIMLETVIKVIVGAAIAFCGIAGFACCVISGRCSQKEELYEQEPEGERQAR